MIKSVLPITALAFLSACGSSEPEDPQAMFFDSLLALCGNAYEGAVVSDDPEDADWKGQRMVIHIRDCDGDTIKVPLHVGEDRSRTWVIKKTEDGLSLKHHHVHEDGKPDAVTLYGGKTKDEGTFNTQSFPVDSYSKAMFIREGLDRSVTNVWSVSVDPGNSFSYELNRENRHFEAEFDLTTPVDLPPPAWGYTPAD